MQTSFIIPQSVAQAILDYLVKRPYMEVHGMVAELQKLQPFSPIKPVEEKQGDSCA